MMVQMKYASFMIVQYPWSQTQVDPASKLMLMHEQHSRARMREQSGICQCSLLVSPTSAVQLSHCAEAINNYLNNKTKHPLTRARAIATTQMSTERFGGYRKGRETVTRRRTSEDSGRTTRADTHRNTRTDKVHHLEK